MGKSSFGYSISFHPTTIEFSQYKQLFLDRISEKFVNDKWVMAEERGSKKQITHIQGFIEFSKEKRSDTFRKTFNNTIVKDMVFVNPHSALMVKPVKQADLMRCCGYPLKEKSEELEELNFHAYSLEYLLECRKIYLDKRADMDTYRDKVRINLRTLPEIFKGFVVREAITDINPLVILAQMGISDYYVLPILLRKDLQRIVKFLKAYMKADVVELAQLLEQWV